MNSAAGRDAKAMLAAEYDVVPSDGVPEIASAAEQLLRRPVGVLKFEDLDECELYDAVWANASLLHVPRVKLPNVLGRIRRALKPGGLRFATYKCGAGAGIDPYGRYYNHPNAADLRAAYGSLGRWDLLALEEYRRASVGAIFPALVTDCAWLMGRSVMVCSSGPG